MKNIYPNIVLNLILMLWMILMALLVLMFFMVLQVHFLAIALLRIHLMLVVLFLLTNLALTTLHFMTLKNNIMATFKTLYTTSELLKVMERCSLIHYYWSYENCIYTFYFVDKRRLPRFNSYGFLHFCCHKSNYYRLREKISSLPFRLDFLTKSANLYSFDLVPDSCFINDVACFKLKELDEQYNGKRVVRVVVI